MKKFTKVLAAITMCAIMLPLTACGDKESSTTSLGGAGNSAPSQSSTVTPAAPSNSSTPNADPSGNSTPDAATSDNSAAGTTSDGGSEASGAFTHGTVTATSYSNSFLGLGISFDSDWVMTTDAELATLNGVADMSAENVQKAFDRSSTLQEMMASKEDGTSTNIVVQDTTKTGRLSEDEYFTTALELLKTQLETTGASVNVKADTSTFLGSNVRVIDVEMSVEGTTVYMYQVPIFRDNYIISVTVGSLNTADRPSLLAMYTAA